MPVPERTAVSLLSWTSLRARVRDWWQRQRTLRQLAECDERDLQRVMHDLNVTGPELRDAVVRGAYPKVLLPQMLHALGLQPERIDKDHPRVADDLNRVCAQCTDKARCQRELDADTAAAHYGEFCFNASTLDALRTEAAQQEERGDSEEDAVPPSAQR